jgi:hypothetical protein
LRHKLAGKYWDVVYVPNLSSRGKCDPPEKKGKKITVHMSMRGQELMEILIHECLHGIWFKGFSEEFVTEAADDISRLIWKELKAKGYLKHD